MNLGEAQMGDEDGGTTGSSAMSNLASKIKAGTQALAAEAMPRLQEPGEPGSGQGLVSNENLGGRMANRMAAGYSPSQALVTEGTRDLFSTPPEWQQDGEAPQQPGGGSSSEGDSDFMKPPGPSDNAMADAQRMTGTGPEVGATPMRAAPAGGGATASSGDPRASAEFARQNASVAASQSTFSAARPASSNGVGASMTQQAVSPIQAAPPGGLLGTPTISHSATSMQAPGPNPSASANSVNGQSLADRGRTAFGAAQG